MPPKQVLDGGLAWNFHVPRRPLGAVPTAGVAGWIAATPPGVLPFSVLTMEGDRAGDCEDSRPRQRQPGKCHYARRPMLSDIPFPGRGALSVRDVFGHTVRV